MRGRGCVETERERGRREDCADGWWLCCILTFSLSNRSRHKQQAAPANKGPRLDINLGKMMKKGSNDKKAKEAKEVKEAKEAKEAKEKEEKMVCFEHLISLVCC